MELEKAAAPVFFSAARFVKICQARDGGKTYFEIIHQINSKNPG
jgi:hypothetical protein